LVVQNYAGSTYDFLSFYTLLKQDDQDHNLSMLKNAILKRIGRLDNKTVRTT